MEKGSYQSFESFLKEHKLVDERQVGYYVDWVRQFSAYCRNRMRNIHW